MTVPPPHRQVNEAPANSPNHRYAPSIPCSDAHQQTTLHKHPRRTSCPETIRTTRPDSAHPYPTNPVTRGSTVSSTKTHLRHLSPDSVSEGAGVPGTLSQGTRGHPPRHTRTTAGIGLTRRQAGQADTSLPCWLLGFHRVPADTFGTPTGLHQSRVLPHVGRVIMRTGPRIRIVLAQHLHRTARIPANAF